MNSYQPQSSLGTDFPHSITRARVGQSAGSTNTTLFVAERHSLLVLLADEHRVSGHTTHRSILIVFARIYQFVYTLAYATPKKIVLIEYTPCNSEVIYHLPCIWRTMYLRSTSSSFRIILSHRLFAPRL